MPCYLADCVTLGSDLASLGLRVLTRVFLKMDWDVAGTGPGIRLLNLNKEEHLLPPPPFPAPRLFISQELGDQDKA